MYQRARNRKPANCFLLSPGRTIATIRRRSLRVPFPSYKPHSPYSRHRPKKWERVTLLHLLLLHNETHETHQRCQRDATDGRMVVAQTKRRHRPGPKTRAGIPDGFACQRWPLSPPSPFTTPPHSCPLRWCTLSATGGEHASRCDRGCDQICDTVGLVTVIVSLSSTRSLCMICCMLFVL